MPTKAFKPCRDPHCPSYAQREGYCLQHARQHWRWSPSHHPGLTRTALYQRLRLAFLVRHPLCSCGEPATDLDHIIPHRGDRNLFFNQSNWQGLCKLCHSRKTAQESGW